MTQERNGKPPYKFTGTIDSVTIELKK